jgi:hypothetical protein
MKIGDKIKCVNQGYQSLKNGNIYEVLSFDDEMVSVININGNKELFYRSRFVEVDTNSIEWQIENAKSLVGKLVEYDGNVFSVTHWGVGNENTGDTVVNCNLVDGYCVYVENRFYTAPVDKLTVIENQITLNENYSAMIEGNNVIVGCQTIPIDKVKEIIALHEKISQLD